MPQTVSKPTLSIESIHPEFKSMNNFIKTTIPTYDCHLARVLSHFPFFHHFLVPATIKVIMNTNLTMYFEVIVKDLPYLA